MKRVAALLLFVFLMSQAACTPIIQPDMEPSSQAMDALPGKKLYLPVISRLKPPLFSTSYYLLTVDSQTLYNMGCLIGKIDQNLPGGRDTVVILDFGSPRKVGSEYGADLFWMGPVGIAKISTAVQNFGQGYFVCAGTDQTSKIYLGIGTTNYHTSISNLTDFYNHGAAWAVMVNNVNDWFRTQGYSSQVIAVGANDIELAWNTPAVTKAWAAGYDSTNLYDFYDYGSLDGCATASNPASTICGNGWTREDAWYITYGTKPAWPLPLIYATNGVHAEQWALLSSYSYATRGYPFIFMGVMTQKQACDQSPGQCPGLDNTPAQGWNQLYSAINNNVRTEGNLTWLTDIKWWDGKPPLVGINTPASYQNPVPASPSLYQAAADQLTDQLALLRLTETDRPILEEKLQIANRILADQAAGRDKAAPKDLNQLMAAPKSVDPLFQTGIFDGPGGIFSAREGDFQNHWQGQENGDYVFISAGSLAGDPSQGIVTVVRIGSDRLSVKKQVIQAPPGSGALQVESGSWPFFRLGSASGPGFNLDAATPLMQAEK